MDDLDRTGPVTVLSVDIETFGKKAMTSNGIAALVNNDGQMSRYASETVFVVEIDQIWVVNRLMGRIDPLLCMLILYHGLKETQCHG